MTTSRQFCRFAPSREPNPLVTVWESPGRACISAFVIVASREHPHRVLLGQLDPRANWEEIGALPPTMAEANRGRWMLPSSHLMLSEAPDEAAHRIVREQLAGLEVDLAPPVATSDVYPQHGPPGPPPHWDLGYLFRGSVPERALRPSPAWAELAFVDVASTPPSAFARAHHDVLERAGVRLLPRT